MTSQNKSEKLSCKRIIVKSVVTWLRSNHYFTQSDKRYVYWRFVDRNFEYVEPQLQHRVNKMIISCDKISRNDRRFLDLMEQKVDVHYKLLLPLKDQGIWLHNNREAAIKRWQVWKGWLILQKIQEVYERTDEEAICKKI